MLLPSIFGENLFDDFFDDVPFFDNRAENQIEKKLYGRMQRFIALLCECKCLLTGQTQDHIAVFRIFFQ
jgi:hypothetical protein